MLNIKKLLNKICAEIKSIQDWITNHSHAVEELEVYGYVFAGPKGTVAVPSASSTQIASITLPKGRWFVHASVSVPYQSDTKIRVLYLAQGGTVLTAETIKALSSTNTGLNIAHQITVTSDTTLILNLYQNSGKSISIASINVALKAVRISTDV